MSKDQDGSLADSFGYWVFRLNRAMHSAFTRRLAAHGVTGAEWTILGQIRREGQTPITIAKQMGIDRAAVTRFLDQLEMKGLVSRTAHPTDGRSTVIVLTAEGASLLPKLTEASRKTNSEFLSLLSSGDAEALFNLIRELGQRLPLQEFPVEDCGD